MRLVVLAFVVVVTAGATAGLIALLRAGGDPTAALRRDHRRMLRRADRAARRGQPGLAQEYLDQAARLLDAIERPGPPGHR